MPTTPLSALLFGDDERGEQDLRLRLPSLMPRELPVAVGPIDLPAEVVAALASLLTMPIGNLAMAAWDKHRRVRSACDRTARKPTRREVVRLVEHTIRSEQHPAIDLDVEGTRHRLLTLTLRVEIEVGAATLVIEHGRITTVEPASAAASATLLLGDVDLATGSLSTVDLGTQAQPRTHAVA